MRRTRIDIAEGVGKSAILLAAVCLLALLGTALGQNGPYGNTGSIADEHPAIRRHLRHAVSVSRPLPGAALLAISRLSAVDGADSDVSVLVEGTLSKSDRSRVDANTPFGLASVTKSMVAALTLIYAERGLLKLDMRILDISNDDDWLLDHVSNPGFRRNLQTVRIRDLLSHRSGLADYWNDKTFLADWYREKHKQWRATEVMGWAGRLDPVCKPDACFEYADTNYVILGLALEQLIGTRLHDQLRTEIFTPLDMPCTWMFFEETPPRGCAKPTHSYVGELDVTDNRMQSADWSGGGLYSTLDDQIKLLRGLFGGKLLSRESLAAMQNWGESDLGKGIVYGLGLYKTSAGPGMTLVGHIGIHNSFSFLWLEAKLIITGSLNQSENEALDGLVYPVVRELNGRGSHAAPFR